MKGPVVAVLLGACVLAGCFEAPAARSPLFAPKLVLDHTVDGQVELFLHSAFGERSYEGIAIAVDNETVLRENHTRAAVLKLNHTGFYLEVEARAQDASLFTFRGRVDLAEGGSRVLVVPFGGEEGWLERRTYHVPYEHILEREEAT